MRSLRVIGTVMLLVFALPQLAGCGTPEEKAQSHYERGKKLLEQNEPAKATIEFKNALQLKKDHVGAWRELAKIEERKQNWQALGAILRKIADLDQERHRYRLQLARLMLLGNALDQSLKRSTRRRNWTAAHAGSLALKAAILLKLNDSKGALREARGRLQAIQPMSRL